MASNTGPSDIERELTFVELALRARGVEIDPDAIDRVRRMLRGALTREQARAEIAAKYGQCPEQ